MATKEARGTKRTCQNPECEERFYDLMREPIICPHCESVYKLTPDEIAEAEENAKLDPDDADEPISKVGADDDDAGDGDEVEEDDALVSLEEADEDDASADDDEDDTFLADDDDDDDVSEILGGPVSGEDKEDET